MYTSIIGNTNKPNEVRKNYKELNKINKELGVTIVIVSHYMTCLH